MPNYKDKAINAVFYAHPDRLQELIDEGNFPQELLEDVGLLTRPFPIWRITQCWEEAMGDDASAYREKKKVADFMARNKAVKEIFQKAGHKIDVNDIQLYDDTTQFFLPPEL